MHADDPGVRKRGVGGRTKRTVARRADSQGVDNNRFGEIFKRRGGLQREKPWEREKGTEAGLAGGEAPLFGQRVRGSMEWY